MSSQMFKREIQQIERMGHTVVVTASPQSVDLYIQGENEASGDISLPHGFYGKATPVCTKILKIFIT
jgi:hypothetical protein